ncbi:MAG: transpeptidase family protein [Candidatus Azobacteroides sp.]|nr:transpeptidase family protein [Candidatus Azobacteroides sp.]
MEKKRILFVYSLFVVLLSIITGCIIYRIFYFSMDKGGWAAYGERRLHVVDTIPAERGNIYDCNEHLLSSTLPQYTFYMDFGQIDSFTWRGSQVVLGIGKEEARKTKMRKAFNYYLDSLSYCLSKEFGDRTPSGYKRYLQDGADKKSGYYLVSRKKATYQQMLRIKDFPYFRIGMKEVNIEGYTAYKSNLSGLIPMVEVKRVKPYGSLASRTIGDISANRSAGGKNGLEYAYDSLLRGEPGLGRYVYASINNPVKGRNEAKALVVTMKEPKSGSDLVSTIDIGMQEIAEKALFRQVVANNARLGMVALMEVKTGEVKAVANLAKMPDGTYQEVRNEILVAMLEPGSTFKTASMMAALEDNVVKVDDPPISGEHGVWQFRPGVKPIRDHNWRRGGYESLTVPEVIYNSSNIGISKIIMQGYKNNPQKYIDRLNAIGAIKPIKIEIPGTRDPVVNNPGTRHQKDSTSLLGAWSVTTLPWMSFGYEFYMTPIYTLNFYNAIANGGVMVRPLFAKEAKLNDKVVQTFRTEVLNPAICTPPTLATIQSMLLGVVEKGTGKPVRSKYMKIAGKTGTTQIHGTDFTNVSFCGYFPADDPKYTCLVMLCGVDGNLSAGATAGIVFKNIAEQIYVAHMKLPVAAAKDTLHVLTPVIKKGNLRDTKEVLSILNLSFHDNAGSAEWMKQSEGQNNIYLDYMTLPKNVIPDVTGMGAKDAVYVMEKIGLRVKLSGLGKVTRQSLLPGSGFQKGQLITIQLD